jgi:hypothetical protein
VIDLTGACARHRPLLVDFVDRGDIVPGTAAALTHLDRCTRCSEAIESTILTITALRRIGDDAGAGADQAAAEAWPRLRARLEIRRRRRPVVMSPLTGIAMSFALVAILVMPVRLGGSLLGPLATQRPAAAAAGTALERRIEAEYIASVRQTTLAGASDGLASRPSLAGNYPRIYPDNDRLGAKEVSTDQAVRRSPEAI